MEHKNNPMICEQCGKEFLSRRKSAKYCCPAHRQAAYELRKVKDSIQKPPQPPKEILLSLPPSNPPEQRAKPIPKPVINRPEFIAGLVLAKVISSVGSFVGNLLKKNR